MTDIESSDIITLILNGLAAICNEKIEKLAAISNEGVEKMAEYMMTKGSGKYDEYSEWSGTGRRGTYSAVLCLRFGARTACPTITGSFYGTSAGENMGIMIICDFL
ncbi:MAG: hypothetical protein K6C08_01850 [Oscillospiraceae bacterium]|nr:hypothetical protein [Oscillospiraceae bacterium]